MLTLESNSLPSDVLIRSNDCKQHFSPNLIVVAPTASIADLTQVAGRIVEVGIHKLRTLGLSPNVIRYALGYAQIPPLDTDFEVAMHVQTTLYCTAAPYDYDD